MRGVFGIIFIVFLFFNMLATCSGLLHKDARDIIVYNQNTTIIDTLWMQNDNSLSSIIPESGSIESDFDEHPLLQERITMWIDYIENQVRIHRAFRSSYLSLFGYVEQALGRSVDFDDNPVNDVSRLKSGQLATVGNIKDYGKDDRLSESKKKSKEWVSNMKSLLYVLDSLQFGSIKYVIRPEKRKTELVPYRLYANDNSEYREEKHILESIGIGYLDLNDYDLSKSMEIFYNTDHHWRIEYAFSRIPDICVLLGKNPDLFTKENYELIHTQVQMVGSSAKRVGSHYTHLTDTLKYYVPSFPTSFSAEYFMKNKMIKRIGPFEETVLFPEFIKYPDFPPTLYSVCNHGDNPFAHIENLGMKGHGRLLIMGDSYAAPIISYMSLAYEVVDAIDLRSYTNVNVLDVIVKNHYDNVLFVQTFEDWSFRFHN